jgi:hypothetical protein
MYYVYVYALICKVMLFGRGAFLRQLNSDEFMVVGSYDRISVFISRELSLGLYLEDTVERWKSASQKESVQ